MIKIKHLVLLALSVTSLGCSQLPNNVNLSSFLSTQAHHRAKSTRAGDIRQPHNGNSSQIAQRGRLLQIAQHLERSGNYQAAIKRYVQLTDAFPDDVDSLHQLAVLQDKHGDPTQSARNYLRALRYAPENAELVCDYGYSRYIQGDLVQAEALLRRAVAMDANLTRGYTNLGLALAEQGKAQEALAVFEAAGMSAGEAQENLRQARIAGRLSSQHPRRV